MVQALAVDDMGLSRADEKHPMVVDERSQDDVRIRVMNASFRPYWYPWPALEFVPEPLIPEFGDDQLVASGKAKKNPGGAKFERGMEKMRATLKISALAASFGPMTDEQKLAAKMAKLEAARSKTREIEDAIHDASMRRAELDLLVPPLQVKLNAANATLKTVADRHAEQVAAAGEAVEECRNAVGRIHWADFFELKRRSRWIPSTLKLLFDTVLLCTHRPMLSPTTYTTDAEAMKRAAIAAAGKAKAERKRYPITRKRSELNPKKKGVDEDLIAGVPVTLVDSYETALPLVQSTWSERAAANSESADIGKAGTANSDTEAVAEERQPMQEGNKMTLETGGGSGAGDSNFGAELLGVDMEQVNPETAELLQPYLMMRVPTDAPKTATVLEYGQPKQIAYAGQPLLHNEVVEAAMEEAGFDESIAVAIATWLDAVVEFHQLHQQFDDRHGLYMARRAQSTAARQHAAAKAAVLEQVTRARELWAELDGCQAQEEAIEVELIVLRGQDPAAIARAKRQAEEEARRRAEEEARLAAEQAEAERQAAEAARRAAEKRRLEEEWAAVDLDGSGSLDREEVREQVVYCGSHFLSVCNLGLSRHAGSRYPKIHGTVCFRSVPRRGNGANG
eukprot:SAG31_NODE_167_length_21485_cov_31.094922_15_plen_623_part_00